MPAAMTYDPGTPSLPGRRDALELVEQWARITLDEGARLGIIRAEPGMGKSALLTAVEHRSARGPGRLLAASCSSTVQVPYLPVLSAIRPLVDQARAGGRPDLEPGELEAIEHLEGRRDDAPGADTASPFLAISALVLGAVASRPTTIIFDDLHAADDASLALIEHLLAAARHRSSSTPTPLLVLGAVRPGGGTDRARERLERLSRAEGSAELTLRGLDELATLELLGVLGPAPPTPQLLQVMHEQTAGNPLFLRLLWRHLLEQGSISPRGSSTHLADVSAPALSQVDLRGIVDLRLADLTAATRSTLESAAVLGSPGRLDELAAMLGRPTEEVDRCLAEAAADGLVELSVEGYRFAHPLLQSAVARQGNPRHRRADHVRAAESIEALEGVEAGAVRVAAHLRAAGPLAPTAQRQRVGLVAADRATAMRAWGTAVAAFDLALDADDDDGIQERERTEAHCRAAEAAIAHDDPAATHRHAIAASARAERLGELELWGRAVVALLRSEVRTTPAGTGDLSAGDAVATRFLAAAGEGVPALTATVEGLRSERCFAAFDFERAGQLAQSASAAAARSGEDRVIGFAWFVDALRRQGVLDLNGSADAFERAAALRGSAPDVARWSRARLATVVCLQGRLGDARSDIQRAALEAEEVQEWGELALMHAWSATVEAANGEWAATERHALQALQLHRRTDYQFAAALGDPRVGDLACGTRRSRRGGPCGGGLATSGSRACRGPARPARARPQRRDR